MVREFKNRYHLAQAIASNIRYGFPAKRLTVIGVTGTDGKTTTASLLHAILQKAGFKSALITTIGAYIGNEFYETGFHTTTPSSTSLQKYIKKAVKDGCTHLVLEVTSHALDQNRAWGIPFRMGIVTNVTHEHLDYHKTYDKYVMAKARLLKKVNYAILNMDDDSYPLLKKNVDTDKIFSYSLTSSDASIRADTLPSKMAIVGDFNKQNALAAAAAAKLLAVPIEIIKEAVSTFMAPEGRQEIVHDAEFKVMVDFAHTPNAFEKVLPEIKKMTPGRLIHVFGAAGKRDALKRPYMGNASSKYADIIILTAEDPRGEKVEIINTQIMAGFAREVELFSLSDRKEAIEKAISLAKKGDTVLITGKGHEKSMNYAGEEIAWNDKEEVYDALNKV